jgi:hypothetical protein
VTFGHDLALCALVYDLCFDYWTDGERSRFHDYMNATVDSNVTSELHVFHNGWYGYKNWGIGLACYASYHENPRAPSILDSLLRDYETRAAPALELAGSGGGWAEGYYVHYWEYEWMFFCEAALLCEGRDLYEAAPDFYAGRAVASMFEMYPGVSDYGSRRPVPMGDGGGRVFGGDRDKALSARRILVNRFSGDAVHQAVHAFNETTARSSVGIYAYKDFLWRDSTVRKGSLDDFRLSHISTGPGHVYARSSWDDDATYFFFKCSDRFTAHQHLDAGHFDIFKGAELAGDGGHYDSYGSVHDVNYHCRTIAHSTVLVLDPQEQWKGATGYDAGVRAGDATGNDGGQHHSWPHHNGAVMDAAEWNAHKDLYDIADITAFCDKGTYVYIAADCGRAYSPAKLSSFVRQIVYIRPSTFVIFDRVESTHASFMKTWQLQAMRPAVLNPPFLTVTNGSGRLYVQTLLPQNPRLRITGPDSLYCYDGRCFPPSSETGPSPQCRIGISPSSASTLDYFVHVLRACDTSDNAPDAAVLLEHGAGSVGVRIGPDSIEFDAGRPGGAVVVAGTRDTLIQEIRTGARYTPDGAAGGMAVWARVSVSAAHGRAVFSLAGFPGGEIDIRIFDGRGRLVRSLTHSGDGRPGRIVWDMREHSGARAGSGAFFYQVRSAGPPSGNRIHGCFPAAR